MVEVGVDCHLFPRHRVKRESRRDFGDALGSFGDDDEVDDDKDNEHDEADDRVAADNEIAECGDDLACIAVEQDKTR